MSLRITFDLSDDDLEYFRGEMKRAMAARKKTDEMTVLAAAEALLEQIEPTRAPDFIAARLNRLQLLIDMVRDEGWAIPAAERARVLGALAYFADPQDLIPDRTPVLGFLDDAIMIELVTRALKHEIDGYEDFCRFRATEAARRGKPVSDLVRADFIIERRRQLHQRIRRRRRAFRARPSGRISSLDLFGA